MEIIKYLMFLSLLINEILFCQLDIKSKIETIEINYKKNLIITLSYENNKDYSQIISIQNWKILYNKRNDLIRGLPIGTNLVNRIIIHNKGNELFNEYIGEDWYLGDSLNMKFKLLKPSNSFELIVVIKDSLITKLFDEDDYQIDYIYNCTSIGKFKKLFKDYSSDPYFISKNKIIIPIDEKEINSYKSINLFTNKKKKLKSQLMFKLNKIFDKYLVHLKLSE